MSRPKSTAIAMLALLGTLASIHAQASFIGDTVTIQHRVQGGPFGDGVGGQASVVVEAGPGDAHSPAGAYTVDVEAASIRIDATGNASFFPATFNGLDILGLKLRAGPLVIQTNVSGWSDARASITPAASTLEPGQILTTDLSFDWQGLGFPAGGFFDVTLFFDSAATLVGETVTVQHRVTGGPFGDGTAAQSVLVQAGGADVTSPLGNYQVDLEANRIEVASGGASFAPAGFNGLEVLGLPLLSGFSISTNMPGWNDGLASDTRVSTPGLVEVARMDVSFDWQGLSFASGDYFDVTFPVPEPSSVVLVLAGLLGGARRMPRRRRAPRG